MADLERVRKEIRTYLDVEDTRYDNSKRRNLARNSANYLASCIGDCVVELYNKVKLSNREYDVSIIDFVSVFYEELEK